MRTEGKSTGSAAKPFLPKLDLKLVKRDDGKSVLDTADRNRE
jgi:hypothetical protein